MPAVRRSAPSSIHQVIRSAPDHHQGASYEPSSCSVSAFFHVHDKLPIKLTQGVFMPGKTYAARIRFCNGAGAADRDNHHEDGRGMAIKLLDDVSAAPRTEGGSPRGIQDFILINHPLEVLSDFSRHFLSIDATHSNCFFSQLTHSLALSEHPVMDTSTRYGDRDLVKNPLSARYFSALPYQLGDRQIIKFSVRPSSVTPAEVVIKRSLQDDGMYDALGIILGQHGCFMTFSIQHQNVSSVTRQDAMTVWDEHHIPFVDVATIYIPPQYLSTTEQRIISEKLPFSPWYSLPEHRPLAQNH